MVYLLVSTRADSQFLPPVERDILIIYVCLTLMFKANIFVRSKEYPYVNCPLNKYFVVGSGLAQLLGLLTSMSVNNHSPSGRLVTRAIKKKKQNVSTKRTMQNL